MARSEGARVDQLTVLGLGLLLLPVTTMWHEIGGHAVFCAVQGGRVETIGAFYVDCVGLVGASRLLVSCAGVLMDTIIAIVGYALWRRVQGDTARLVLWLLWVTKAFVAAGYFCFSGASGVGDLGPGSDGGIGPLPFPLIWRLGELAIGVAAYITLVIAAIRTLGSMIGTAPETAGIRKQVALGYYLTIGALAVVVGLFNPVGLFITIFSAAASSFGGNAGFMSIGFGVPHGTVRVSFELRRNWPIIIAGTVIAVAFAVVLGPSIHR